MTFPIYGKIKTFMFQTTNQIIYSYSHIQVYHIIPSSYSHTILTFPIEYMEYITNLRIEIWNIYHIYHILYHIIESSHRACAAVAFLARPAVDAVDVGAREEVEGWGLRISWWHFIYIYNTYNPVSPGPLLLRSSELLGLRTLQGTPSAMAKTCTFWGPGPEKERSMRHSFWQLKLGMCELHRAGSFLSFPFPALLPEPHPRPCFPNPRSKAELTMEKRLTSHRLKMHKTQHF